MRILITYLTYSGNTEEIAEYMADKLVQDGIQVDMHEIGIDLVPVMSSYDYILLGTFTWEQGATPDEIKDFVLEVGYKPDNIAVFGSGDTQFGGDELFCRAVEKLTVFYESKWRGLKIEQSPRGYQEAMIDNWMEGVLENVYLTA